MTAAAIAEFRFHLCPSIWLSLLAVLAHCATVGCNGPEAPKPPSTSGGTDLMDIENDIVEMTLPPSESPPGGTDEANSRMTEQAPKLESAGAEIKRDSDGRIAEVHLIEAGMTDELALELAELAQLRKLTIRRSSMSDEGWRNIGRATKLQHLDARECPMSNEQLRLAVSQMPELIALRLNGQSGATTVDDLGMAALAACPRLKLLALDHLWVGEEGLAQLADHKRLTELYMAGTLVDDAAMRYVAELPALRKIRLAQTSISGDGISYLEGMGIEDLDVSECSQLSNEAMLTVGKLIGLKRLNLFKTTIADAGVAHLTGLRHLEWLNLDQTPITDAALPQIAQLESLRFLHLGSTAVSDAGMPDLLPLKSLKNLIVTRTSVSEDGVRTIKNWIPEVEVQLKYESGT